MFSVSWSQVSSHSMDEATLFVIAEVFGFFGGILSMVQAVPQAWRIYRMNTGYGVSLSAWLLMLYRMSAWAGYGFLVALPSVFLTNIVGALTSALVVVALLEHRHKAWLWIIPTSVGMLALMLFIPNWLIWIILVGFTLSRLPQLFVSFMNMRRGKVTAVSISAIVVGTVSMACWAVYGWIHQDPLVLWTTLLAAALMLGIGGLELYTNKHALRMQNRLETEAGAPA